MWNADDQEEDTLAMIPDRCYARSFQAVIEDCKDKWCIKPSNYGNCTKCWS